MSILFTITDLGMGGAQRQVCDLADTLFARGHQVTITYLLQPAIVRPKSKEVELIWLGGTKSPIAMFKALMNLVKLIKKVRPDVVHSHMYHANIVARLAKIFVRSPRLVCTAHNTNEGSALRMFTYRMTNALADVFTNVSQDAVAAFETKHAAPMSEMLAIYNGIDTDTFKFNESGRTDIRNQASLQNKTVFIAIGRFHVEKDYPNLLAAFNQLVHNQPNIHLLIVGDGELRETLEQTISDKQLTNSVTLLGVRNDIPELLSVADVFVLSSASEGFGLVVAEAMACERRVVATDSGGVAEVLGQEGFLVPPKNSEKLALAMEKALLLTDGEAKVMGIAARNRIVDKYSLNSVVDNWLNIYNAGQ